MRLIESLRCVNGFTRCGAHFLVDPALFALRVWVAWAFLVSGWNKLQDFDNTRYLFANEYAVPLLPPDLAAVMGTAGEIIFPVLLILGLSSRLAALGLWGVNLMAVLSYPILLEKGFEAALKDHQIWGLAAAVIVVFGAGRWSADGLLARGGKGSCRS